VTYFILITCNNFVILKRKELSNGEKIRREHKWISLSERSQSEKAALLCAIPTT
jgi:hypothetical protein